MVTLLDIFQAGRGHGSSELCVRNNHLGSVTMILCDNFGAGQLHWAQMRPNEERVVAVVELEDFDHAEACAGFYPLSQMTLRGDAPKTYGSSFQGKDIFTIKAWATGTEEFNHEAWTVCFDSFRSLATLRRTAAWVPPGPAVFVSADSGGRDVVSLQLSLLSTVLELQMPAEAPLSRLVAEIWERGYPNPLILGPRKQRWTGFGSDPALQGCSLRVLLDA
ncbi:unnamed protein product [Effrenium voratum]|nr:unnamed protein product [Effrenium voratum]